MESSSATGWKPVSRLAKAIEDFEPNGKHQIEVLFGDTVEIYEEYQGWYRGAVVSRGKKERGIFPSNFVVIVRAPSASISSGNDSPTSSPTSTPLSSSPIAPSPFALNSSLLLKSLQASHSASVTDSQTSSLQSSTYQPSSAMKEVNDVLNEWQGLLKSHYSERRISDFNNLKERIGKIIALARLIMRAETAGHEEEKNELVRKVQKKIESGKRSMGLELSIRLPTGQIASLSNTGPVELLELVILRFYI
eukprot:TRINITY_DN22954_c0_g1_i1.p1 TRINITY_DN22954_c0_g1~~TRINITY_DN22954_c0_g1_i1.p1  ORF type:complete len:250 (+),score=44.26 TRINITY_DN22954_c0_g1_i1:76-825(+)